MARDEKNTYESYSKDGFDNPPEGPVGVHQGKTSLWSRLLPYIAVVIIAVLAGLLAWGMYSGELYSMKLPWSQSREASQATRTDAKKSRSTSEEAKRKREAKKLEQTKKDDAASNAAAPQPAPAPAPAPTANKQTVVRIVNGTRIAGHAANRQSILNQSGYANVTVGNLSGPAPSTSVVWYQNESDKVTADDVAQALGIPVVQQQSGIAAPITVVLLN